MPGVGFIRLERAFNAHCESGMNVRIVIWFVVGFLLQVLFAVNALAQVPPGPLDTTTSLSPVLLAGRTVNPNSPDGAGSGAFLQQPEWVTGCGGTLYFSDQIG